MVIKNFIFFASILFLSIACSDNNEAPGKQAPLNFDETKKTVDYKMQTATFTAERAFWGVGSIWEIIGSDTLVYNVSPFPGKEIKGDWYKINAENKTIVVTVFENQSDKMRELILDIVAGNTGEVLYIIQNKK